MSSRRGFTFLELMAVMLLFGIFATVAIARFTAAMHSSAVVSGAREFVAAYDQARSAAVRYGRTARLNIIAGDRELWVEADTSLNLIGVTDTIGDVVTLGDERLTMKSTASLLCFDGLGARASAAGCATGEVEIVFVSGTKADTLTVLASGKLLR